MDNYQNNEQNIDKAWFEKEIDEWDQNDEQEAYLNLFVEHPPKDN